MCIRDDQGYFARTVAHLTRQFAIECNIDKKGHVLRESSYVLY